MQSGLDFVVSFSWLKNFALKVLLCEQVLLSAYFVVACGLLLELHPPLVYRPSVPCVTLHMLMKCTCFGPVLVCLVCLFPLFLLLKHLFLMRLILLLLASGCVGWRLAQ